MATRLPPELVERIVELVVEQEHEWLVNVPYHNDPFHRVDDWQLTLDRARELLSACALVHPTWTNAALRLQSRVIVVPDLYAAKPVALRSPRFVQRAQSCTTLRIFKLRPPSHYKVIPKFAVDIVEALFDACKNARDVFVAVLNPSQGMWRVIAEHGLNRLPNLDTLGVSPGGTGSMHLLLQDPYVTPTPPLAPSCNLRHLSVKSAFPLDFEWLRLCLPNLDHVEIEFSDDVYDADVDRAGRLIPRMTDFLQLCVPHIRRLTFRDLRTDSARYERPGSTRLPLVEILSSGVSLERLRLAIDRSLGYESQEYVKHLQAVPRNVRVLELGEFYSLPQVRQVLKQKDDIGRYVHLANVRRIIVVDASTTRWTAMRTSVEDEQKWLRSVCEQRGIALDVQVVF
ncbi:hypothetical protein ACM66B_006833 [Microbotryomycetes sp. NB124-2]